MPNCFTLTKRGEFEPTRLVNIDNDMREALGEPPSATVWLADWPNYFGLRLAMNQSWKQITEGVESDIRNATANEDGWPQDVVDDYLALCMLRRRIVEWLAKNYTVCAWAER